MSPLPRTVFLADDDEDDCLIFLEELRELDCHDEVIVSRDGIQLMKHLEKVELIPYVLFLDLNMPGMNGFDCLREIRLTKRLNTLPIIVLSTSTEPADIGLSYQLGATFYMPKARSFPEFVEKLRRVICFDLIKDKTVPFNEFILPF